jgi:putative membrane protein
MQQASTFFTKDEVKQIEAAVAEAESKTSAEIVPVVATASGRYDRPEDVVGVWCGAMAAAVVWFVFRGVPEPEAGWGFQWGTLELPAILVAMVVGFVAGAAIGSAFGTLRRLFTPRSQMRDEVALKARQVFFDNRVHHTEGATGLLVYLSLYERMAAVLADDAILQKLGQNTLDELCAKLTKGMRDGAKAEGVCKVLKDAGEALGKVLPRADDDVNELEDTLVVLDE